MGDLESLFLVLAVIYASECAVWVSLGGVAFSSWLGKHWQAAFPGGFTSNSRGGFIFAHPLPPLGTAMLSSPLPFSVSPEAVFGYVAGSLGPSGRPRQTRLYVRFHELQKVSVDGKKIFVNGALLVKTSSTALARKWAQMLRQLQSLRKAQRADALKKVLSQSLDAKEIQGRLETFHAHSKHLRIFCNFLFVYLFILFPPLLWRFGFGLLGLALLGGAFVQSIMMAILFRRAHKAVYPGGAEERFTPFLTMLLAPPTAIRAHDILGRHLLEEFHPVAVAQVLCPPEAFKSFARQVINDLQFPMLPACPANEPNQIAVENWARSLLREGIEQFLSSKGCSPQELMAPPAALEDCNHSYCPRCWAQFTMSEGTCADCGGLALRPLRR